MGIIDDKGKGLNQNQFNQKILSTQESRSKEHTHYLFVLCLI